MKPFLLWLICWLPALALQAAPPDLIETTLSPANGAINVSTSPALSFSFDINVVKGSGNITLTPISGTASIINIPVSGSNVTISGTTVTVTGISLVENVEYSVSIDAGAFVDANNASDTYDGTISGGWQFTTTGSVNITAPNLSTLCADGTGYEALGDIIVEEVSKDNFEAGNGQWFILQMPAGFQLKASIGMVSFSGTGISLISYNITENYVFIEYDVSNYNDVNTLTISGLQVRALNSGSGNIYRASFSSATIAGLDGTSILASLSANASPAAAALAVGTPTTFCVGDDLSGVTFPIDVPGSDTYHWYTDASLSTLLVSKTGSDAATASELSINSASAQDYVFYVVRQSSTTNCLSPATEIVISIKDVPTLNVNSSDGDNAVCQGEAITFTGFSNAGTLTVTVDGNSASSYGTLNTYSGGFSFTTSSSLAAATYTLQVQAVENGCAATQNIPFTIHPLPTVSFVPPATVFYQNQDPVALTGGAPTGGNYSGPGVFSNAFYPGLLSPGNYVVTYEYSDGNGCTASAQATFEVKPAITDPIILDSTDPLCSNNSLRRIEPNPSLYSGSPTILAPGDIINCTATANEYKINITAGGIYSGTPGYFPSKVLQYFNTTTTVGSVSYPPGYYINPQAGEISSYPNSITLELNYCFKDGGSGQATLSYDMTIYEAPSLSITAPANGSYHCTDANISITSSQDGNADINLSYRMRQLPAGAWQALPTNVVPSSMLSAGTDYEIEVRGSSGSSGCTTTQTVTISTYPDPLPLFTFTGSSTYCEGSVVLVLDPSATTDPSHPDYLSNPSSTFDSTKGYFSVYDNSGNLLRNYANGVHTLSLDLPAFSAGNYKLRYTYTGYQSCNIAFTEQNFDILPLPTVSFSGLASGYCLNSGNVTLGGTPAGGTFHIRRQSPSSSWETLPANTFSAAAPLPSAPLPPGATLADSNARAGTYEIYYEYTDVNGCANQSSIQTFTIYSLPDVDFAYTSGSDTYCANSPVIELAPTRSNGVLAPANGYFTISRSSPAFSLTLANGDNDIVPGSELAGPGTYRVRYHYTDENGCSHTSVAKDLYILAVPTPSFSGLSSTYCVNDQQNIALTPLPAPGGTFRIRRISPSSSPWESLPGNVFKPYEPLPSESLPPAPADADRNARAGTYEVKYVFTDGNGCIGESPVRTVTVNPLPEVDFSLPGGNSYCESDAEVSFLPFFVNGGTITPSSGYFTITKGAFSLQLSNGDHNVSIGSELVAQAGTGTYSVYYTYNDGTCDDESPTQTFDIYPLPQISFSFSGGQSSYCIDAGEVTLIPTRNNGTLTPSNGYFRFIKGAFTYTLNTGDNTIDIGSELDGAGIYQVTYHYTDENGCSNVSAPQSLTLYDVPQLSFTAPVVCFGTPSQFNAAITLNDFDGNNPITQIQWDYGDNQTEVYQGGSLPDGYTPQHTYANAGNYNVTLTVTTAQSCTNSYSQVVRVGAIPQAGFTVQNFCINEGINIQSTASITSPDFIQTYLYDFGDGSTSTDANPQHNYAVPGKYKVVQTVTSDVGCSAQDSLYVLVFPQISVQASMPYYEDFESGTGGWLPFGSIAGQVNQYSWAHGMPSFGAVTATQCWHNNTQGGTYAHNEQSFIESPCFDISSLQRPMLRFDLYYHTDASDGLVLQASTDDGASWQTVGTLNEGIAWYNAAGIAGQPGGQALVGWSGNSQGWATAAYPLDAFLGASKLRLRLAFGSNADNVSSTTFDGIAFDNVFIGERNRKVLLETFTNTYDTDAVQEVSDIYQGLGSTFPEASFISYHTSFPSANDPLHQNSSAAAGARGLFYGASTVPKTFIDGYGKAQAFGLWGEDYYKRQTLIQSPLLLKAQFVSSPVESFNVKITLDALQSIDTTLSLFVAAVEEVIEGDELPDGSLSGLRFYYVVRHMIPDPSGTPLPMPLAKDEQRQYLFSWLPENIYHTDRLWVVAWVQNTNTDSKQVYQSAWTPINYTPTGGGVTATGRGNTPEWLLYPNPAEDKCYLIARKGNHARASELRLYDLQGQLVLSKQLPPQKEGYWIGIDHLASGVYSLHVYTATGEVAVLRLVKW